MPFRALTILLLILGAWCVGGTAHGGSPWYVDTAGTGRPYTWGSGYLPWYYEKGGLGPLTEKQALEIVQQSFDAWKQAGLLVPGLIKVPTAALNPTPVGVIAQAITFETSIDLIKSKTVIVFDNDGSILSHYADPEDVAAMTFIGLQKNDASLTLKTGLTVLSGKFLEKANPADPNDLPLALFKATVIHELGHLLNLDHSALGQDIEGNLAVDANLQEAIPTMYPIIITPMQGKTLHDDDVVAISNLYPLPDFTAKFCTIAGTVIGSNGKGFQGAMVIARSKLDPVTEAMSAITGNNFPQDTADGSYFLRGIRPGRKYVVEFTEINPNFVGGSSIQPYGDDDGELPKSGFGGGAILSGNGKLKEVSCEKGGQTIVMDTVQLTVEATGEKPQNSQVPAPPTPSENAPAEGNKSGGGCSLIIS